MVANRQELALELGPVFHTDKVFVSTLYRNLATPECIDAFLDAPESPFRRNRSGSPKGRWMGIPKLAKLDEKILGPLLSIIEQVKQAFSGPESASAGVNRVIRNTRDVHLVHESGLKMRPDLVVVAEGPSFEIPSTPSQRFIGLDDLGYTNTASVFEVRRERGKGSDQDNIEQLGFHCQQIFHHQPNRNFVRAILITETRLRLVHYDRTGVSISPFCNYHNDPHTFIRLILGLMSTDEATLGLDATIQWTVQGGKKLSGTITTSDKDNDKHEVAVYRLKKLKPVFSRSSICGRATTCWLVEQPGGKDLVIKDSWRTGKRMAEHEYLDAAKGIPGVVQMISYQYLGRASDYIPPRFANDSAHQDRSKLRIVMEAHGPALEQYRSRYQLVAALRSAIQAHRKLYMTARVLHRDISVLNILLGDDDDALDGYLIDLDMGVFHDHPPREISAQLKTGTRTYQSIAVLDSYRAQEGELVPPHDYLDDLESFFYVLSEFMMNRVSDGKEVVTDVRGILKSWNAAEHLIAQNGKVYFVMHPFNFKSLDLEYWGQACVQLLKGFRQFVQSIANEKAEIRVMQASNAEKMKLFKGMWHSDRVNGHYDALDALFEKALDDLKIEEPLIEARLASIKAAASPPAVVPSHPVVAPAAVATLPAAANPVPLPRRGTKRRLQQLDEIETAAPPKRRSTRIVRKVVPFVNWK